MVSANIESGARFDLRRTGLQDAAAIYEIVVELPAGVTHTFQVTLSAEADLPDVAGLVAEAPDWVCGYVTTLVKQVHRKGKKGTWPRKVRQWKAGPGDG